MITEIVKSKEGRIFNLDNDILFQTINKEKGHNGECLIILDGWRIDTNKLMEEEEEQEEEKAQQV